MRETEIRNEREYRGAVRRVKALWHALQGSPEADESNLLIMFIEKYERDHPALAVLDKGE